MLGLCVESELPVAGHLGSPEPGVRISPTERVSLLTGRLLQQAVLYAFCKICLKWGKKIIAAEASDSCEDGMQAFQKQLASYCSCYMHHFNPILFIPSR